MTDGLKRLPAVFYHTDGGNEPVRQWLKRLDPEDRKTVGDDIRDLEFAWLVGCPCAARFRDTRAFGRFAATSRTDVSAGSCSVLSTVA